MYKLLALMMISLLLITNAAYALNLPSMPSVTESTKEINQINEQNARRSHQQLAEEIAKQRLSQPTPAGAQPPKQNKLSAPPPRPTTVTAPNNPPANTQSGGYYPTFQKNPGEQQNQPSKWNVNY